MILPAQTIRKLGIVTPFFERTLAHGRSFGLSSAGYDIRLAEGAKFWHGCTVLVWSIEHFAMPADVLGRVTDKSTNKRLGLSVGNTVIEPGWRGCLQLEPVWHRFFWQLDQHLFLAAGTPIAQVIFERLEEATEQPYAGKYQDQEPGLRPAIIEAAA